MRIVLGKSRGEKWCNMFLRERKKSNFYKTNILFILLLGGLILAGSYDAFFLHFAFIILALRIVFSDISNSICWSVFLISNLKMFNGLNASFLVNILMVLPLAVLFIRKFHSKNIGLAISLASVLFFVEMLHILWNNTLNQFPSLFSWTLGFCILFEVLIEDDITLNKEELFDALSLGILFSAIIPLSLNVSYAKDIVNDVINGERFAGLSGEPNYFSLYIVVCISCFFNLGSFSLRRCLSTVLIVLIGFLTASKMEFILILFLGINMLFLGIFSIKKEQRKYIKILIGLTLVCCIVFRAQIPVFISNFVRRLGGQNAGLNRLTTGRANLWIYYLKVFFSDPEVLLFGKGFGYNRFLDEPTLKVAHNTYIDFLVSWGIIGTILFVCILCYAVKRFKKNNAIKVSYASTLPLLVFFATCFSLSCLSADMFSFIILVCVMQFSESKKRELLYGKSDASIGYCTNLQCGKNNSKMCC